MDIKVLGPFSSGGIADLLGGRLEAEHEQDLSRPLPEAQIATLREAFERYTAPCPFKPGDIITPRDGFGYSDAGVPHIVLEVRSDDISVADGPIRPFDQTSDVTDIYSNAFGSKLDIRVAVLNSNGHRVAVCAFWQESWRHQPYTGAGI